VFSPRLFSFEERFPLHEDKTFDGWLCPRTIFFLQPVFLSVFLDFPLFFFKMGRDISGHHGSHHSFSSSSLKKVLSNWIPSSSLLAQDETSLFPFLLDRQIPGVHKTDAFVFSPLGRKFY